MASTVTESIEIAKPPESVWDLLTTAEQIAEWYDDWDAVEYSPLEHKFVSGRPFVCRAETTQPGAVW